MKILCIGHVAYDITIPMDHYPIENTKNRVKERVECGGGPASNGAYLLGKWGMDVTFAGVVGKDLYGDNIKKEFEEVGVNITYLEQNPNFKTTSSYIIANKETGSRTILTYRKEEMKMTPITLDFEPDVILLDGREYELTKMLLETYPNAISIIDAERPTKEIIELSQMVTYVVCSKEFAEKVSSITVDYDNLDTLKELYLNLEEKFHTNIVVTLESKGCLYQYQNKVKLMTSIKVDAIDSTGAGDIFHGAFTYGIANQFDYETVVKISNIAGGLSVTKIGGRYSIPTKEEVKELCADFK